MGVAYYDPDFPCAIDELIARADALMYEQKRAKRRAPVADVPVGPSALFTPLAPQRAD
jgi:hypothetical protein